MTEEPDWGEVKLRLKEMTLRQIRPVLSRWFNGSMCGASRKSDVIDTMVSIMSHWWRLPNGYGRARVRKALRDLGMGEDE